MIKTEATARLAAGACLCHCAASGNEMPWCPVLTSIHAEHMLPFFQLTTTTQVTQVLLIVRPASVCCWSWLGSWWRTPP